MIDDQVTAMAWTTSGSGVQHTHMRWTDVFQAVERWGGMETLMDILQWEATVISLLKGSSSSCIACCRGV
jgi:hypothetical protein